MEKVKNSLAKVLFSTLTKLGEITGSEGLFGEFGLFGSLTKTIANEMLAATKAIDPTPNPPKMNIFLFLGVFFSSTLFV